MKWLIITLALLGVIVASLALREHYNTGASPCRIDDKWDCGVVNHSSYAVFHRIPVALIGIGGYLLLGGLAFARAWKYLLAAAFLGLLFSLYLTRIEASILQVWCIYCVSSLGIISLIVVSSLIAILVPRRAAAQG
ncbi:MAG TPA: vitamin K epoxide reductase family protein [Candidatus Angelobacter sp.]|nr:vitamin K epoxide reductase family protein [Candidatus Angelobacter sp.]